MPKRFAVTAGRRGGAKGGRKSRPFAEKESRRWLTGTEQAAGLLAAGAACVTVIADREGDIYEEFACRSPAVELLIRAGQDRALADGGRLFGCTEGLPELGRMTVEVPAAPGRSARRAVLALRACRPRSPSSWSRRANSTRPPRRPRCIGGC